MRIPLAHQHPFDTGAALRAACVTEMELNGPVANAHVSFSKVLREALRTEAAVSGISQSTLIREAVLDYIAVRIDERKEVRN